jgi:hypothetical protein
MSSIDKIALPVAKLPDAQELVTVWTRIFTNGLDVVRTAT